MNVERPIPLSKSDLTKERLLARCLELFKAKGFDGTTMRELADAAELSPGAFYYYFKSKEAVVQVFYEMNFAEFRERCQDILQEKRPLIDLLEAVIRTRLETLQKHRAILKIVARAAVDPTSELSPFGVGTAEIREKTIAIFDELLKKSEVKFDKRLEPYMPSLLWMYLMGIILFWMFDESPAQKRSHALARELTPQIARLIRFTRLPLTGSIIKPVLRVLEIAFKTGRS